MTFCKPVSYTQPKIFVTYLIFRPTAELTHGLACCHLRLHCCWYILQLRTCTCTWTWTQSHAVLVDLNLNLDLKIVDLDLTWTWLLLNLIKFWFRVTMKDHFSTRKALQHMRRRRFEVGALSPAQSAAWYFFRLPSIFCVVSTTQNCLKALRIHYFVKCHTVTWKKHCMVHKGFAISWQ